MKKYTKPFPTIRDIINTAGHDFDYVSYRIPIDSGIPDDDGTFAGCFRTQNGNIIPLDGDIYSETEAVLASEEWSMPEAGITHGLTIIANVKFMSAAELNEYVKDWKEKHQENIA